MHSELNDERVRIRATGLFSSLLLVIILVLPAAAQEESQTRSGFDDVPRFGGPNSVGETLRDDDEVKKPWFRLEGVDRALKPWFDWKGRLNKDYGLSFGFDYTALGQIASDTLGNDNAAGGIFRFFGNWGAM